MERLQQLLKQQSLTRTPFQQQMPNQLSNSQNYLNSTNSHEQPVNHEDDEDDESLQEFSKPNNNQSQQQQQQKQTQLSQQTPPPMYQQYFSQQEQQSQQPMQSEFSLRHQSQAQQSLQGSSLQPSVEQQSALVSLQNTQQQQQQQQQLNDQPFNRKFRQSWRKTPDNLPTRQLKKATKLLENDFSLQDDDYEDEEMTEDDIFKLHEELENTRVQNNEMKTALIEARTIIDQQQNQLTEFRRYAAQYQTDAEAFKMKSMFLLNNTQTHDEQVNILMNACERLEAEVDALTWQLDRTKQSLDLKTQECHFLNEQLDEIQLNGSYHSPNITTDNNNHNNHNGTHNHTSSISKLDKLKTGTDQFNSILSTEYKSLTNNSQLLLKRDTMMSELDIDIKKLHEEITNYEKKEKQWEEIHEELLKKQKLLEEEKKQQDLIIARLTNEQVIENNQNTLQNNNNNNNQHDEIPVEIITKLNNLHEEKTTWRLYATSLVRSFVENCDEFIRKTPYNEPYFESDKERRWYTYSMHLLENLLNIAPYQLTKTDLDLIKRNKNSILQQTIESNNSPELLTALDFPSQVQLNNSYIEGRGGRGGRGGAGGGQQQQQLQNTFTHGYDTYNRESRQSYQQRAARVALKPLTNLYRKKK